jgi:hypothetical protein|tara:strand:+ start:7948 stop:8778 length:831 start_codon:yes stop_codon:yes gene_type:complete
MLIVQKPQSGLNGVAFNSKASMSLPVGPTYQEIHLVTSLTPAQIRQVSVVVNGDTIVQVSGADLMMMEKYKKNATREAVFDTGVLTQKGVFVIPFTNPNAKNQNGQLFGGLITLAGENITLEIEIGAGTGTPILDVETFQSVARASRPYMPRIKSYVMQAQAEGWNDFTTFPANAKTNIRRAYFKSDVSRLKIERDGYILFDKKKDTQEFQQERVGRAPQAGYFSYDPTMYGYEQADILNTGHVSEFVFRVEVGTAGAIPILVESVEILTQAQVNA